jgi:hypothetical protein
MTSPARSFLTWFSRLFRRRYRRCHFSGAGNAKASAASFSRSQNFFIPGAVPGKAGRIRLSRENVFLYQDFRADF